MHTKEYKKTIIAFVVTFVLLGVSFFTLLHRHWIDNNASFNVQLHSVSENEPTQDICIKIDRTKIWMDGFRIGAQYDGVIYNNTGGECINWELVIKIPTSVEIESSWNGEYIVTDSDVLLVPDENISVIPAMGEKPFGFVMHSNEAVDIEDFVMSGQYRTYLWNYEFFWIWCLMVLLWIVFLVASIITNVKMYKYNKRRNKDIQIITQTFKTFANLIDAKDTYTQGHSNRVADYTVAIAKRMRLPDRQIEELGYVALMHDCGKIGVPDNILNKPGALTEEERKCINEHTVKGGQILENFTAIKGIRQGALYHHERFDGKGYPEGLKGKEIPLYARIIGVADAFDAMNSDRCYRKRLPQNVIIEELKRCSGSQFDPDISKHLIQMLEEGCFGFEICEE
ncbi:MAG: HD domain-containing protein [Lachnospiraceae bacterium]|nr:HD domain-containing protein [Lachnospiraceae bacterium]